MTTSCRSTPPVVRRLAAAARLSSLAFTVGNAFTQSCQPAPLRGDPGSAWGAVVVRVAGDYPKGGVGSRTVRLRAGQS
jgi:hypothetical protein